jgi:hypothetical protein
MGDTIPVTDSSGRAQLARAIKETRDLVARLRNDASELEVLANHWETVSRQPILLDTA